MASLRVDVCGSVLDFPDEGTIFFAIGLPDPWPPLRDGRFLSKKYGPVTCHIGATAEGRVFFELEGPHGRKTKRVQSAILTIDAPGIVLFTVIWHYEDVRFTCGGVEVGPVELHGEEAVKIVTIKSNEKSDECGMREALQRRTDLRRSLRLSGVSLEQRVQDLEIQLHQLTDYLSLLSQGRTAHIGSVARSLRTLICSGRGNQLIQEVASLLKAPLIVYAAHPIFAHHILHAADFGHSLGVGLDHAINRPLRTDLDAWLKSESIYLDGRTRTNNDILSELGDKIGAHVDTDRGPIANAFSEIETSMAGPLDNVMLEFGEAILALGLHLLEDARKANTLTLQLG